MPKASEVANELRKLAVALDKEPEATVETAWISFYSHEKEPFLTAARLMPRPLRKEESYSGDRYEIIYGNYSTPIRVECSVDKSSACVLIEPAKPAVYDCLPILEQNELDEVSS